MPSMQRLKEVLSYNPETGEFHWIARSSPNSHTKVGDVAGALNGDGYVQICIDGVKHKAHRLAFLYMTGEWPQHQVDHPDRNRGNNAWVNLREATHGQNSQNRSARNNKTGHQGVFRQRRGFAARISCGGERIYLGTYPTIAQAAAIYRQAAADLHGEFAGGGTCL